ncbi:transcription factor MYB1-like [Arachis ipaensis]|uniref:transcription factor MYB1-like n=1 Tax=Arachis ipaensis TaxID=130454 RepID=UPI0007AF40DD|nr:transcription factor MYB1-like [Arachis ipaensis]XP_029151658.1 transcription factor MYB73-like [Arachis hypogaea]
MPTWNPPPSLAPKPTDGDATRVDNGTSVLARLRWCNQLSPQVEHRTFTSEEDDTIIRAHARFGNKWAIITRLLFGKTDNTIKNHWNSPSNRRRHHSRVNGGGEVLVADGDGDDGDGGQKGEDADGEPGVCSGDVGGSELMLATREFSRETMKSMAKAWRIKG